MNSVVHIGLGKTATKTLQRHIFPIVAERLGFIYNQPRVRNLLEKSTYMPLTSSEADEVCHTLQQQPHFISLETLVNWDPAFWEQAADRNLALLGNNTRILISLREPLAWMTSVYQQKVHGGSIIRPEHFFLPKETHKIATYLGAEGQLEYFSPDDLDFERLIRLYHERFSDVFCVEMDRIGDMEFLVDMFSVNEAFKDELAKCFASAPRENKAFSSTAMSLTFKREKLLNLFGLKTLGSSDRRLEDFERIWQQRAKPEIAYKKLPARDQFAQFPQRVLRRMAGLLFIRWEALIRNGFDRIYPYHKYHLPDAVYLNHEKIDQSRRFLKSLTHGDHGDC